MKKLKNLLIAVVVIYFAVSGVMIGIPYLRYVMFSDQVDNIARGLNFDGTVERTRNKLIDSAVNNKIPVTDKDFIVQIDPKTRYTLVEVEYTVTVVTPFKLYTHVWNFHPRAEYGKK